jgi:dethiobiotin synthetase
VGAVSRRALGPVVVTGTDTGVGKTVVTAAIAAAAGAAGRRVAVVKPAQTGTAGGEPSDVEVVTRLAAPAAAVTLAGYPDPLAPLVAARQAGAAPVDLGRVADAVRARAGAYDLVLVEGAGGLLVPMGAGAGGSSWTLADLAVSLGAPAVVVVRAGLGTLNHTALTLEALRHRSVPAYVVIGAWPAHPATVHRTNLALLRPELAGVLPEGAGGLAPEAFRRSAPGWLAPVLHGRDGWWGRAGSAPRLPEGTPSPGSGP